MNSIFCILIYFFKISAVILHAFSNRQDRKDFTLSFYRYSFIYFDIGYFIRLIEVYPFSDVSLTGWPNHKDFVNQQDPG